MIDVQQADEKLNRLIKLKEFPVAVKMLGSTAVEEIRERYPKAKIPRLDLKIRLVTCQAMAITRKYGWELVLFPEDISCPTGLVTLGFAEMIPSMLAGKDRVAPLNQDTRARGRRMERLTRFPLHRYAAIVLAPLARARFEPDSVVIYGNSAQVMRLVQGAVFFDGGSIASASAGGQGCSQYLTFPVMNGECRYVLPGNGDRIFGLAGDDQMIFAMPWDKVELTLAGLEESHKGGQRYPIPAYLQYEARMPADYEELTAKLLKAKGR